MKTQQTKQTIKENNKPLELIEETRKSFTPFYKKSDMIQKIVLFLAVLLMIFGWLILPMIITEPVELVNTLKFVLVLVPLFGVVIYSVVTKKVIKKRAQNFFTTYYKESNNFVFDQKEISKLVYCEPPSISKEQFDENKLYKDVYQVNSKGYCTFNYHKLSVGVCDAAALIKQNKRPAVTFAGKYLFSTAKYSGKERVVIYFKGTGIALPPTNVEGMKKIVDNNQMIIYSTTKDINKVISTTNMKKIKGIKTNKLLVDLTLSISSGKQYVCMGYDDPLMVPPFETEFDSTAIKQYKKEVYEILSIMEALA